MLFPSVWLTDMESCTSRPQNWHLHLYLMVGTKHKVWKYWIYNWVESFCLQMEPLVAVVETSLRQGGIVTKGIFRGKWMHRKFFHKDSETLHAYMNPSDSETKTWEWNCCLQLIFICHLFLTNIPRAASSMASPSVPIQSLSSYYNLEW